MAPVALLCLMLCVTALAVQRAWGEDDDDDEESVWPVQRVPLLLPGRTELLRAPEFGGRERGRDAAQAAGCGIGCQSALPPPDQERMLGYETVYENGTRTQTEVTLDRGAEQTAAPRPPRPRRPRRRKRQVYGEDGRFVISDARFATRYPFSAAVRLSTGCSGVLVSPRHVLTAAHCVHDGGNYLEGARRLRVGVLQLRGRRRGGTRRRAGRRRGGGGGAGGGGRVGAEAGAEREEGENGNGVGEGEPEQLSNRRGGGGGRRGGRRKGGVVEKEEANNTVEVEGGRGEVGGVEEETEKGGGGGGGGAGGRRRGRRRPGTGTRPVRRRVRRSEPPSSSLPQKLPSFRWCRVKLTHVPKGWIHGGDAANANAANALDYDYALLELKRPVKQKHMELGAAPPPPRPGAARPLPLGRVHFSGFDTTDKAGDGGGEQVVYRFCSVMEESEDLLYQRCDAQERATGAGVYVRLRRGAEGGEGEGGKGRWERRVIGVFSGHRRLEGDGEGGDFNVAVRITPAKYAQICYWIQGDPSRCQLV